MGAPFSVELVPNLSGKVILLTGGAAGIGLATARALAAKNPSTLIITSRNGESLAAILKDLSSDFPEVTVLVAKLDLASFLSIEHFHDWISRNVAHLDILINNAGVYCPDHSKTKEGFEVTLGINAIGSAYLTQSLLPLLKKSRAARIIMLTSAMMTRISPTCFESRVADVGGESVNEHGTDEEAYAFSKLLIAMYAKELHARLQSDSSSNNIVVVSTYPNPADEDTIFNSYYYWLFPPTSGVAPELGALAPLYCATSEDVSARVHGGLVCGAGPYVSPSSIVSSSPVFTDENCRRAYDAIESTIKRKLLDRKK
jgi:NAD(P)-dependent dehydrogenase (short-subunit alcohol dehydrogenase family)